MGKKRKPFLKSYFALTMHKIMISTHLHVKGDSRYYATLISLITIFTKQTTVHLLVHDDGT